MHTARLRMHQLTVDLKAVFDLLCGLPTKRNRLRPQPVHHIIIWRAWLAKCSRNSIHCHRCLCATTPRQIHRHLGPYRGLPHHASRLRRRHDHEGCLSQH